MMNVEEEILRVLREQPDDAYGVTLVERIQKNTGKEVSTGGLYVALHRMEKRGDVISWWGEATPERGFRRKRYFKIAP